jgi:hypothetical protein
MPSTSATVDRAIEAASLRYGFARESVAAMLEAIVAGGGGMAQFDIAECGGHGQWMRGGMTMISAMFDGKLKARVTALCDDLADFVAGEPTVNRSITNAFAPFATDRWWPEDLGVPNAAGSQNGSRYAYFAASRRLAIDDGSGVIVYDTLDHAIRGVSQQQSTRSSLAFESQRGIVDVSALPRVTPS